MSKRKSDLYAVILAGGSGVRFWPVSRKAFPKQFIPMVGEDSLFRQTLKRVTQMVSNRNILIVTNIQHFGLVRSQGRPFRIPLRNILLEPEGKNTAPAICWAALEIYRRNPLAVMGVFPSDHLIANEDTFQECFKKAVEWARKKYLVTLGIVPHRPETGYGYLKTSPLDRREGVLKVDQFVEKPTLPRAKQFVKARRYLWNSGMFFWRTDTILEAFRQLQPDIIKLFYHKKYRVDAVAKIWKELPSISIDYGIMEKTQDVVCVRAKDLGWSDLGSWAALWESFQTGREKNYTRGPTVTLDTKNSVVWAEKKLVAAVGVEDLVIVDTEDALLITRRDMSQRVKEIKDIVTKKKFNKRKKRKK